MLDMPVGGNEKWNKEATKQLCFARDTSTHPVQDTFKFLTSRSTREAAHDQREMGGRHREKDCEQCAERGACTRQNRLCLDRFNFQRFLVIDASEYICIESERSIRLGEDSH
jgi:hypothetical protein